MKSVKTPKGTDLPLISLKGKDYLQVAHRLIWFNEVAESFEISTNIVSSTADVATVSVSVTVFDKERGTLLKKATGTKTEHKSHFPDFLEKAETGALGRALAMMGYGTQFAIADLDEGDRIVDSPVTNTKAALAVAPSSAAAATASAAPATKPSTWRRLSNGPAPAAAAPEADKVENGY